MFNKITNITIGIRYVRSFRISDISGEIIDDILGSKSPFDDKHFPKIGTDKNGAKVLYSEEHDDVVSISRDEIILSLETDQDPDKVFKEIKDKILPYFIEEIMSRYLIKKVTRLGIIFRHKLNDKKLVDKISKELTFNSITEPNEMLVRFSKKLPTMRGVAVRGNDNYRNIIYTFETLEDDLLIDIDYQHYFSTPVSAATETNSEDFMDKSRSFMESESYTWLKKYILED